MVFQHFHSLTKIKATQLQLELRTIKKGTRTCSEYLLRISTIVEILASIGSPISPREHVECIVGGLPPEYDLLISTITAFVSRDEVLSPGEIETMILAQEARLEQAKTSVIQEPLTTNLAQTTSVANGVPNANLAFQQSQMPNSQPNMFQNSAFKSQGGYNASFSGQNRDGGCGRGGSRGGRNRGSSVQCQICHKRGHEASTCYQRSFGGFGLPFGPNFSPYTSLGFGSQTSYGPQNFAPSATQQAHLSSASSSQRIVPVLNTATAWIPDSRASHHATPDPQHLLQSAQFIGAEHIVMANGQRTSITSIGPNMFRSPIRPSTVLSLKDLLLVPNLTKNLISVSKFAKDNNVYFVFYPHSCFVKSQDLNETLLEGKLGEDGLYRFHPSLAKSASLKDDITENSVSSFPKSCIFLTETCTNVVPTVYKQWHLRLGHPHHDALTKALKSCNIHVPTVNKISYFCDSCCIAKSHRIPSQSSTTIYSKPLELVFLDVWGPASLESSCGYSYFLTCVDACTRYMWIYLLHKKLDVFSHFLNFKALAEKQFQYPLKFVQTDGGGEFRSMASFLQQQGIDHRLTCPYAHHQNGMVERRH
uniref:Retrovirus-related Pol polyprotein from transposon TNT 1-94 n=1 Tax=Cajanus cajan TaxID=3821 RepID=A0A151TRT3_CAJCA|nr:Retrovirus-related Pol polyprotein from transposon TNT 1-94 [Cajanus cajan]